MALVMLPCDLPWWSVVQKKLNFIQDTDDCSIMIDHMHKLHDLCNVSLDPDEDKRDSTVLDGLKSFLENDLENCEREHFLTKTVNSMARRASELRNHRPPRGLEFSLQQQHDSVELNYKLVASLVANAFFSTFPKRTVKTHPTLQDFNFTNFFSCLDSNSQKAKLKSLFTYFDWLDSNPENDEGCVKISRKVMTGKQWLTIEDWLECELPLCSLEIKHEGRLESSSLDAVQNVFVNSRIGGHVLQGGNSQEAIQFSTIPEMLVILLYMEALEDNEAVFIEGVRQVSRIIDPKKKMIYEKLEKPRRINLCCMDAESYFEYPVSQFEEDNVLRELNKCLLGYRQNTNCAVVEKRNNDKDKQSGKTTSNTILKEKESRRLSPIGESGTNSPLQLELDTDMKIFIKQASTSTKKSSCGSIRLEEDINKRRSWLVPDTATNKTASGDGSDEERKKDGSVVSGPTASGRRGRFIILGSSGECLPVNRRASAGSVYSSCESSGDDEEYHSAKCSFDSDDEEANEAVRKYLKELDTPERRNTFAQKLKDALQSEEIMSETTDDSYAVGISVAGSKTNDPEIRLRRGGSRGFMLTEDSLDEDFYKDSLLHESEWLDKFRNKQAGLQRKDTNESSKYSFDSEYSSELEEVYEQFQKWLDDPILDENSKNTRELDPRDEAVLRFANSLLKRTLSESFVGVPLTEGCVSSMGHSAEEASMNQRRKNKMIVNPRSLSLELAKHKHRLAAQLKHVKRMDNIAEAVARPSENRDNRTQKIPAIEQKIPSPPKSSQSRKWSITCVKSEQSMYCDDVIIKHPKGKVDEISQMTNRRVGSNSDLAPVATGNWGCGHTRRGDPQLKLAIQWMAASVAGLPVLIYYTTGHERLTKLDTVCRVLRDRKWSVGELASSTLLHARDVLSDPFNTLNSANIDCFFDKLIGLT